MWESLVNPPVLGTGNRRFKSCRLDQYTQRYSQAVRHRFLVPACVGSNPATSATHVSFSVASSHVKQKLTADCFLVPVCKSEPVQFMEGEGLGIKLMRAGVDSF